jgi:hypothetical protein
LKSVFTFDGATTHFPQANMEVTFMEAAEMLGLTLGDGTFIGEMTFLFKP